MDSSKLVYADHCSFQFSGSTKDTAHPHSLKPRTRTRYSCGGEGHASPFFSSDHTADRTQGNLDLPNLVSGSWGTSRYQAWYSLQGFANLCQWKARNLWASHKTGNRVTRCPLCGCNQFLGESQEPSEEVCRTKSMQGSVRQACEQNLGRQFCKLRLNGLKSRF
jgi:hypothetical protein